MTLKLGVRGDAKFSVDGRLRWWLERSWEPAKGFVFYIGLNPSKAGADVDDMTVVKGMGFARQVFDAGGTLHGNAFPYISTKPNDLIMVTKEELVENDRHLVEMARRARVVVFAWGSFPANHWRFVEVAKLLRDFKPICFGRTKDGYPKHISRIGYKTPYEAWRVYG